MTTGPFLANSVANSITLSQYEMWRSLIFPVRVDPTRIAIFATKLIGISFGAPPEHRLRRIPAF
jgi:hypothetical protein